ncbi:MAG: hypothetical protein WBX38_19460, partial [Candidatus Sulfotelmatobacter sp.]
MNKELFVSSTPHETKVGLVEDDLLAEIYLERENEYTLAGSIYKGRVTRVLPGMQSAFVDIGLERDAFLYVSDFMELEEHDEDLTDVVPANRGVQDMRQQSPQEESASSEAPYSSSGEEDVSFASGTASDFVEGEEEQANQLPVAASPDAPSEGFSQDRERGGYRGRRRRRGGRRDGRGDGRDRGPEPRVARPISENIPVPVVAPVAPRHEEPVRAQQFGPPAGYQPILLPGESISKYRGLAQAPAIQERHPRETRGEASAAPAAASTYSPYSEPKAPVTPSFPDDEPIFASSAATAPEIETSNERLTGSSKEEEEEEKPSDSSREEDRGNTATARAASTSVDWNREFHRHDAEQRDAEPEQGSERGGEAMPPIAAPAIEEQFVEDEEEMVAAPEKSIQPARQPEAPVFAAPGTLEEETIDEEEADTARYVESSDEGYDEFEEETRAAGQLAEVRATVDEIHMTSLADAGIAPSAEDSASEEDSEDLQLEEAQAEAEALLAAEAGGTGVDTRAEVRAPAGTAGYTQRSPRPRPGYDRQRGGQRRGGGRRFPRRQSSQEVPKISDLLKEGQEILVQIAKEPIAK